MRLTRPVRFHIISFVAIAVAAAACAETTTEPSRTLQVGRLHGNLVGPSGTVSQFVSCPTTQAYRAQGVIGPNGGSLDVPGVVLKLPPGAVAQPTQFEIVVPASSYLEAEIHAVGAAQYIFQQPATIIFNLARCSSSSVPAGASLQGAHIDTSTYEVLEVMGGVYDAPGKKVTFSTGHLSGYIVAY